MKTLSCLLSLLYPLSLSYAVSCDALRCDAVGDATRREEKRREKDGSECSFSTNILLKLKLILDPGPCGSTTQ